MIQGFTQFLEDNDSNIGKHFFQWRFAPNLLVTRDMCRLTVVEAKIDIERTRECWTIEFEDD